MDLKFWYGRPVRPAEPGRLPKNRDGRVPGRPARGSALSAAAHRSASRSGVPLFCTRRRLRIGAAVIEDFLSVNWDLQL